MLGRCLPPPMTDAVVKATSAACQSPRSGPSGPYSLSYAAHSVSSREEIRASSSSTVQPRWAASRK